jgi:uncharacterized protein
MTHYFILPGLGNSGPEHWQTWFERSGKNFIRINQSEWDAPLCQDWVDTIAQAIEGIDPAKIVLVGHSLACAAIAHWAKDSGKIIKGALLVAPSDLEAPQYQDAFPAKGFVPIPKDKFRFKTIVVASEDDIWVSFERAKYFAEQWGSEFISLGNAGHINAASGYGVWEEGLEILKGLE